MKTTTKKYLDKMARDLKEWSATIDEYEVMASRKPVSLQPEFEQSIRDLKEKRDLLSGKLRELRESRGDIGKELEAGVETAKHGLRDAFETARRAMQKAA